MRLIRAKNYDDMSLKAANIIAAQVSLNPKSVPVSYTHLSVHSTMPSPVVRARLIRKTRTARWGSEAPMLWPVKVMADW